MPPSPTAQGRNRTRLTERYPASSVGSYAQGAAPTVRGWHSARPWAHGDAFGLVATALLRRGASEAG